MSTSAAIINILKDCGCYEYKEFFAGLKSKDDLYRFSLKELGLILPPGQAGKWAAYTIHNHLFNLQREEFQGWIDPRHQLQYANLVASSQLQIANSQLQLQNPAGGAHNSLVEHFLKEASQNPHNPATSSSSRTSSSSGGAGSSRSRGESKYESSPHIISTTDNGKKVYACRYCEKKFSAPNQAVIHSRKHTGEKPYQCDECNKAFSQISSRNLHVRTHHQD